MDPYERRVRLTLERWQSDMKWHRPGLLRTWSLRWQRKLDGLIPLKVHDAMAQGVRIGVSSLLGGLSLIPVDNKRLTPFPPLLEEADRHLPPLLDTYKKWAAAEGAGTGAGGLILAAVDFPALISIKLKFLQEVALLYGFDIRDKSERVFLLHVFQLAFSSPERRQANFEQVKQWEKTALDTRQMIAESIAWRDFYMDYKQYIEFRKLLQILPGIGAVIGAWANHSLMDDLGKTAQNAFRLRYLQKKYGLDMPSYADKGTSNNGP